MKTKKYLIAIAIFGGMLFAAQAINAYDFDGQETAKIDRGSLKGRVQTL